MAVTDFFVGEIVTELLKQLFLLSQKSCSCRSIADSISSRIEGLLPIINEIKYSGVELPDYRQSSLDRFSETLRDGVELCQKILHSNRWNVYKNVQRARKLERLEKRISAFINGPMQGHILADVHHMRFQSMERFDRMEASASRLEQSLASMKIGAGGGGGWVQEAVRRVEVEEENWEANLGNLFGVGMDVGKKKVKEMLLESEGVKVVGICGIGGSGKTTLATELCRDDQVRSYFQNKILFLTVSQSPNVEQLKARIQRFVTGNDGAGSDDVMPQWNLQFQWGVGARKLIVLDDVWSQPVLDELICKQSGCKTLFVSRFKFPHHTKSVYEVELLSADEALSLFCHSAFGQQSIPLGVDQNLVKQIVNECKGLPLALKVIGASLRDQPEMYWASAWKRLSRGEPICDSHENELFDRMAISIQFLHEKVRECFLDLGSFPEDMKIPLDVLINMWVETHGLEEQDAFGILVELANKNLITLSRERAGDQYSSYYEISVTQHDVLRDLAIHLSNREAINKRKRLLMPRRESGLPREWEKNADQAFSAEIVSIHTGEMKEMEWFNMEFPKAEVVILNFSAKEYFLPPFINNMPRLRALIVINQSTNMATLHNLSVFSNLFNLRSLWLERVSIAQLTESTVPLKNLRKISLFLCKINNSFNQSAIDLPQIFPSILELTIDHCDDLTKLPSSICRMQSLKTLSITNCHNLQELPDHLGNLRNLEILRLYACPRLRRLPPGIGELGLLEYLDISQCINLEFLPECIGKLSRLVKIDMRECPGIWNLPKNVASLQSLRTLICDEEVSLSWKNLRKADLHVQVAEKCFSLDWLDD